MRTPPILVFIPAILFSACSPPPPNESTSFPTPKKVDSERTQPQTKTQKQGQAERVEIALDSKLDAVTNNYCLDIAGGNKNVDPNNGLQAHTCYSYRGELGTDQIFDATKFSDNILYMPIYDVCVSVTELDSGSKVGLSACDQNNTLQYFSYSGSGRISPVSAPAMCFTAAQDTRFGRAKQHQIKNLTLEPCSDVLSSFQIWRARTSQD